MEAVRRHRRKRRERSGEGSRGRRWGSVRRGKASEGDGRALESACGSGVEEVGGGLRTSSRAASLGCSWRGGRVERRRRRRSAAAHGGIWWLCGRRWRRTVGSASSASVWAGRLAASGLPGSREAQRKCIIDGNPCARESDPNTTIIGRVRSAQQCGGSQKIVGF